MKKYGVIYADPPWYYRVWSKKGAGRSAEAHYPTMSMEAIKALPVADLAAKVAFVWVKQNKKADSLFTGMGYWTRANAEVCLLATRGRPKRRACNVHQIILSHIEAHSQKPAEARRRI